MKKVIVEVAQLPDGQAYVQTSDGVFKIVNPGDLGIGTNFLEYDPTDRFARVRPELTFGVGTLLAGVKYDENKKG